MAGSPVFPGPGALPEGLGGSLKTALAPGVQTRVGVRMTGEGSFLRAGGV